MQTLKRRNLLALFFITIIFPPLSVLVSPLPPQGRYRFLIDLDRKGNAEVKIEFTKNHPGSSWVLIPRYKEWKLNVLVGKVSTRIKELSSDSLYSNLTFSFNTSVKLSITYDFEYASLVSRSNALFLSPLIGYSKHDRGEVYVLIEEYDRREPYFEEAVIYGDFSGLMMLTPYVRFSADEAIIRLSQPRDFYGNPINVYRLAVSYKIDQLNYDLSRMSLKFRRVLINGSSVTVTFWTPRLYSEIAEELLDTVERGIRELSSLTLYVPDAISGEFWLPRHVNDISSITTLGFVEAYVPKRFSISLFTLRMRKEERVHVVLHELAHVFLLGAGIPSKPRWVQEGLAEYISLMLGIRLGYSNIKNIVEKYLCFTNNPTLPKKKNNMVSYPVAFRAFYDLLEPYGGLKLLPKVFRAIKSRGGISRVEDLALIVSKLTGEDLGSVLNKLKLLS